MSSARLEDDELYWETFGFDFDLDDDELKQPLDSSKVVKRRKCSAKNDIRRYIPQLLLSVLNTIEFDKLLTFFHTFMVPDSTYLLEYIVHSHYVQNPMRFLESRGPELTAFMFTGYGALFPDMTLTANDIRISTNIASPITKITMICGCNFTNLYDFSLEWALKQLQGVFRSHQPDPHKDLQFRSTTQQIDRLNLEAKKNKVALRKKLGHKAKPTGALTLLGAGDITSGITYSSPLLPPIGTTHTSQSINSSDRQWLPSAPRPPVSNKCNSRSGKYDLTALAYSIFDHLPRVTPKACFVECAYTIYLDANNRIKNIAVTAVQPSPGSVAGPAAAVAHIPVPIPVNKSRSTQPAPAW